VEHSLSCEEALPGGDYALFAAIAANGSLSAAGRALNISAPMVSKRLARLERRLGTQLVHRTTRRLALTERGARFHTDVLAILAAVAEAEHRASGRSGTPRGPLRLSAPTSFGRLHVAPHLCRFLDAHPEIDLTLDLSDGFEDLIAGRIDLAIRITAQVDTHLVAHRLATSRRILCAAPAYLSRQATPIAPSDLSAHRLLAATGQLPWRLVGPAGRHVVDGVSAVATNSSEVVRELALAGAGVALRSLWDIEADLAAGRLVRVLGEFEGSTDVGIYAVHPQTPQTAPTVAAMIAFFADLYATMPR
jgi:DNA-binding transcriptional LysR family regulator